MKNYIKKFCIFENSTIFDCSTKMNENNSTFLAVINKKNKLLGTFSMGDLRQALYIGAGLNEDIKKYYNKKPKFLFNTNEYIEKVKNIFKRSQLTALPVVNKKKIILNLFFKKDALNKKIISRNKLKIPAVIMSGGTGTRLKPFSDILPKALIPINNKAIIERIIEKLTNAGIKKIYIITNYKSKIIKAYFKDKKYKIRLKFIEEKKELGTAGGLSLLKKKISGDFLLTNCDVLHNFNYADFKKFHTNNNFSLSIVGSLNSYVLPYGVCEVDSKGILNKINEKPSYNLIVNTGFYILNKKVINLVPLNKFMHITELIAKAKKLKFKIGLFPINNNNWHDVGEWDEFHKSKSFLSEEK